MNGLRNGWALGSAGIGVAALAVSVAVLAAGGAARAQRGAGHYPDRDGAGIYDHVCQGCHMADARGAVGAGAYPALAGDPKLAAGLYPALVILRGQKGMPPFAELDDEQIAAVVNHVRSHFGNHYSDAITAAQVKAIRPAPAKAGNRQAG